MTKRNTRSALLVSALAMFLCLTMFIGTTFAWFTDTVTSSGNKIVAGSLKVDLEVLEADNTTWTSVKDSNAAIFDYTNWEPGYTQVKILRVVNEGSLAFKWKATLNSTAGVSDLAKVIDVYVKENVTAYPTDRADLSGWDKLGTLDQFIDTIETTTVGTIKPNDTKNACEILAIAFKMQEDAGNEYQEMTLGEFDLTITATQLAFESDSFGDQYDAFAEYDGEISSADSLKAALKNGGTYKVVSDITIDAPVEIPAGVEVALDLNGKTITSNNSNVIKNSGTLTVVNGVLDATTAYTINNAGGNVTIKSVKSVDAGFYNAGTMVVEDCEITNTISGRHGFYNGENADLVIDGGTYSTTSQNAIIYNYNGTVRVDNGSFTQIGSSYMLDGTGITINGGTFTDDDGTWAVRGSGYAICGGTFNFDPTAWLADGYVATKNADGTYTVVEGAAVADVADLTNALANGGNVVLTQDIAITSTLTTTKDVVIDLNGNTMTTPSSGAVFQSQSNASPDITITSSTAGAAIEVSGGDTAVLLGYGSTVINNVTINVNGCDNYSPNPFSVYGDLTLGEGTVVNVDYLGTALINNNGAIDIVIDGAKINIAKFKTNGTAIITLNQASTLEIKNTEIKIAEFVLSPFGGDSLVSKVDGVTIEGCTFDVTDSNGAECTFVAKDNKYRLVQK